jgi:hypothetical protein
MMTEIKHACDLAVDMDEDESWELPVQLDRRGAPVVPQAPRERSARRRAIFPSR